MAEQKRTHRTACKVLLAAILLVLVALIVIVARTVGDRPAPLRNPASSTIVTAPHPDPGSLPGGQGQ